MKSFVALANTAMLSLVTASAASGAELHIDLSACFSQIQTFGQPIGVRTGNTGTAFARVGLRLADPAKGNNVWVGLNGSRAEITLAVDGVDAVFTALNTYYGQNRVANATVRILGNKGGKASFPLLGNVRIRDFNNLNWTNTINGTTTQTWWQSVKAPVPNDQSKRIDVQRLLLDAGLRSQRITRIVIASPADAGSFYMQPLLFAVTVRYSGRSYATPVCKAFG